MRLHFAPLAPTSAPFPANTRAVRKFLRAGRIYESVGTRDSHAVTIPRKGDRIELLRPTAGIRRRGIVFYADELQVLVKLDDGRSKSIRPGIDHFRVIES